MLEDGQPATVLAVEPASAARRRRGARPRRGRAGAPPPRSDAGPGGSSSISTCSSRRSPRSARPPGSWAAWPTELAALGEVEVVMVDDEPNGSSAPAATPRRSRRRCARASPTTSGSAAWSGCARSSSPTRTTRSASNSRRGMSSVAGSDVALVRAFGYEEARLLEGQRQKLESYFAERSVPDWPQAAFLVTGGYDLEPERVLPADGRGQLGRQRGRASASAPISCASRSPNRTTASRASSPHSAGPSSRSSPTTRTRLLRRAPTPTGACSTARPARCRSADGAAPRGALEGDLERDRRRALVSICASSTTRWRGSSRACWSPTRSGAARTARCTSSRSVHAAGVEIVAPAYVTSGTPEALAAARAKALLAGERASAICR